MGDVKLREALQGFLNVVNESQGVAGYHLNGDIAEWGEFPEVDLAVEALALPAEAVELTSAEREQLIRKHGTGGWQTIADMDRFALAVIAAHQAKRSQS